MTEDSDKFGDIACACERCGDSFTWAKTPKGGRPPLYCLDCRKPSGPASDEDRDREGYNRRRNLRRARLRGEVADVHLALMLAVGLATFPDDPRKAAGYVGLLAIPGMDDDRLTELAMMARDDYAGTIAGEPEALANLIRLGIGLVVVDLLASHRDLGARDAASSMNALGQVRAELGGTGSKFGSISLTILGPAVSR